MYAPVLVYGMDRLLRPQTRKLDAQVTLSARGGGSVSAATSIAPRSAKKSTSVAIPKARGSDAGTTAAPETQRTTSEPSTDLLVRFGFASFFGKMLARVLMVLLFMQPVYVAMGMELPEEGGENSAEAAVDAGDESDDTETDPAEESFSEETEESAVEEDAVTENAAPTTETEESDAAEDDGSAETTTSEEALEVDAETGDGLEDTAATEEDADGTPKNTDTSPAADTNSEVDTEESEDTTTSGSDEATGEEEDDTATDTEESSEEDTDNTGNSGGGAGDNGASDEEQDETTEDSDTASTTASSTESVDESATTTASTTEETTFTDSKDITDRGDPVEESASTTASTTDETAEVNFAQNPQSKFVFGESECTIVTSGEFYCVSATEKKGTVPGEARVYTRTDLDGDKEIFYHNGIDEKRITNNDYDDMAPVLEEDEQRIAWHGMRSDRLQIFLYDIRSGTTEQVTNNNVNSNNPHMHGDTLVWQEWGENNWDIMMVEDVDDGFDVERVTENGVHDMFPQVYEDLITWQRERGAGFEVVVMDRTTGKETVLEKHGDGRYENPRFALLFDARQDNGDTQTVGFDINTGEIVQLGSKPYERPVDNPVTPDEELPEAMPSSSTTTPKIEERGIDDTTV